jgi:hypothetical protein
MILKIGYDFENWVWFWKLGMILKIRYDLKILTIWYDIVNKVGFWKLVMIWKLVMNLKIGYDFENLVWFGKFGMI